jgi:hypothetical protein
MTNGTLRESEAHPAALDALEFVKSHSIEDLMKWREAFASCAIEGNRAGEVCGETLDRLLNRQMVSDRYVLGLAWAMRKTHNVELTGSGQVHRPESSDRRERG